MLATSVIGLNCEMCASPLPNIRGTAERGLEKVERGRRWALAKAERGRR